MRHRRRSAQGLVQRQLIWVFLFYFPYGVGIITYCIFKVRFGGHIFPGRSYGGEAFFSNGNAGGLFLSLSAVGYSSITIFGDPLSLLAAHYVFDMITEPYVFIVISFLLWHSLQLPFPICLCVRDMVYRRQVASIG